jgi:hypothetical protein
MGQRPPLQGNHTQLPILPGENLIIVLILPNIPNVLPVSHLCLPCRAVWSDPVWTRLPCTLLFSLYVNETPTPSRQV